MIAVARTCKAMLKSSGESRHPCLVPDLSSYSFSFSPLKMLAVGLSYMDVIMLRWVPLCPLSEGFLSEIGVGFCQSLFLHLLRGLYGFYSSIY